MRRLNVRPDTLRFMMKLRASLGKCISLFATALFIGCQEPPRPAPAEPLAEYLEYNQSERLNRPESFIDYLRKTRFTHGELDHIPPYAIIFYGDPTRFFPQMGITPADYDF